MTGPPPDPAEPGTAAEVAALRVRRWRPLPHEIVAAAFVVAGIAVLESLPVTYDRPALVLAYAGWIARLLVFVAVIATLVRWVPWLRRRFRPRHGLADEAVFLLRTSATLLLTLAVHFLLKSFIYLVNPRNWDHELDWVDRTLHLGIAPGPFLTTLLDHPWLLHPLDVVYSGLYYLIVAGSVSALLTLPSLDRRLAFAAAFTLTWIGGTLLYLALPSWGPVFIPDFVDDYEAVLQRMPLTVQVQAVLFEEIRSLVTDPTGLRTIRFGSVAAFPSLHVAVVSLFTIASRGVSRPWFVFNVGITACMVIGSVVTGYHYLVDAWAGLLLAAGAWWLARRAFPGDAPPEPESDAGAAA